MSAAKTADRADRRRRGPLSVYLSQNCDRQVIDHDVNAADRFPTVRSDQRGNGRDRDTADRQSGLPKPSNSPVGW